MNLRRLKIGVIGVGHMGQNHVRILSEERGHFDLVGIYDTVLSQAKKVATKFETCAFTDLNALLDIVEAVIIAVPSSLHKEIGLIAASHEVHALIEKPLAMTSVDAKELCSAFATHGCKLAVGHVERFNPVIVELSKILNHERIIAIEAKRYSSFDGRITDASVVEDLMIHDIDLVCSLMHGHTITQAIGLGQNIKSSRLDFVQSLLEFDNGVQASVNASRVTEDKIRELCVHTYDSFIRADLLAKTLLINQKSNLLLDEGGKNSYRQDSVIQKIFVPIIEPLRAELSSFYDAVINGHPVQVDGKDATNAIVLCEKIISSITPFSGIL